MGNCLVYRANITEEELDETKTNELYTIKERRVRFDENNLKQHPIDTYNDYIHSKQFKRTSVYENILS